MTFPDGEWKVILAPKPCECTIPDAAARGRRMGSTDDVSERLGTALGATSGIGASASAVSASSGIDTPAYHGRGSSDTDSGIGVGVASSATKVWDGSRDCKRSRSMPRIGPE